MDIAMLVLLLLASSVPPGDSLTLEEVTVKPEPRHQYIRFDIPGPQGRGEADRGARGRLQQATSKLAEEATAAKPAKEAAAAKATEEAAAFNDAAARDRMLVTEPSEQSEVVTFRHAHDPVLLQRLYGSSACPATITQLSPDGGPSTGNTFINVTGTGFEDLGDVNCLFLQNWMSISPSDFEGPHRVNATVIDSGLIQCHSPPLNISAGTKALTTRLKITLNGVDYSKGAPYTIFDHGQVQVDFLRPNGGPTAGGTSVKVVGEHFRDLGGGVHGPMCKFGGMEMVHATYVDFSLFLCEAPENTLDLEGDNLVVPVEISFNGYDSEGTLSDSGVNFTYYRPESLNITNITPRLGPARGGTMITVTGTNFQNLGGTDPLFWDMKEGEVLGDGTFCRFGGGPLVPATIQPDGDIWCQATSLSNLSAAPLTRVNLQVTMNGEHQALTDIQLNNVYTYYQPPVGDIGALRERGGPLDGNTSVLISGALGIQSADHTWLTSIMEPSLLRCRFGYSKDQTFASVAEVSESGQLLCNSPPLEYDNGSFVAPGVVRQCQDKRNNGRQIRLDSPLAKDLCVPVRRSMPLEVTLNGQDFGSSDQIWTYYPQQSNATSNSHGPDGVAVTRLQPFGGPASGGTLVSVFGPFFRGFGPQAQPGEGLLCKFGDNPEVYASLVNPAGLEDEITCISPENTNQIEASSNVYLEVTLNNQTAQLTVSKVNFTYYDDNDFLVSSIYPQGGSKAGGNAVIVYGQGFQYLGYPGLVCKFGNMSYTTATLVSGGGAGEQTLTCRSPPYVEQAGEESCGPEQVVVRVSNNLDPEALTDEQVMFTYT